VFVHTSSDLGILADRLAEIVSAPGLAPLEREVVLIQSAGMQRWLSRELAQRLGIAANLEFPFPRAFLKRTLGQLLGAEAEADRYERTALSWELYALLGELPEDARHELLRRYLGGATPTHARLVLSEQLAHLYDQYLTYRPRLIFGWEAGQDSGDFQGELWRRLRARLGPHHLASRIQRLLQEVTDEQIRAALPARISLVGGPGLPPPYLQVLGRLGQAVDVHVLSLLPTGEYIADLRPDDDPVPEFGRGAHPLLVSMGTLAADYRALLDEIPHTERSAEFPPAPETTLLSALQRDIAEASRRDESKRLPASYARDGTITLDSCHSRLREVEVLKARLLGWFHEDPSLRPEDIVVLSPDIEAYSPLITAVLSARSLDGPKIPFRIADRSEGSVNPAARALLLGMTLLSGRLKVSEVLDFLQCEPVTARFGLSMVDLERVGDWVEKAGIRFGADAGHLHSLGLGSSGGQEEVEDLGRHTWQVGLERLLLGYALEDDGQSLFAGLVPVDDVPAGDAPLLGRFAEFVEGVLDFRRRALAQGLTASAWQDLLRDFARALLGEGEGWDVDAALWTALGACAGASQAVPDEALELEAVLHLLGTALSEQKASSDFLSYGVTFCALLPLRTIPFRRVCVLGLDQASFPRRDQPHQLDLLSSAPKRGDRSLRAEDRQLFLEWIVGAKERLSLSYVGRSIQDDSECPASVVVAELAEVLRHMVVVDAPPPLTPRQHPLQPFSPRYFSPGSGFESFDAASFAGALALTQAPPDGVRRRPAFYLEPLPPPARPASGERVQRLELADLVRFWKDPARGFLARLRVGLDDDIQQFEDRETVSLDGLGRYQLGDNLLQRLEKGLPVVREVELGRGGFPLGAAGEVELGKVGAAAARLRAAGEQLAAAAETRWVDVELDLPAPAGVSPVWTEPVRLAGRLAVRGAVLLEVGFQRASARAQLGTWIRHLALCAAGAGERTILLARPPAARWSRGKGGDEPATIAFGPLAPEQALGQLENLVRGYLSGQRTPLCFSPEASLRFVRTVQMAAQKRAAADVDPEEIRLSAHENALRELDGIEGRAFFEVFRDEDPRLGLSPERAAELQRWSHEVFGPLLAHQLEAGS